MRQRRNRRAARRLEAWAGVVTSAQMQPRVYLFEELAQDLPRPPLAALRSLHAAGVAASPAVWTSLPLDARRIVALEGAQEVVSYDVVMEALRGVAMSRVKLIPKFDLGIDVPTRAVAEAIRRQALPPAMWASLAVLDRWVLNRVSRNERLMHRALREIAIANGVTVGAAPSEPTVLARCEIAFAAGTVATLRGPALHEGRSFLLARVAGVRAARATPSLLDRYADALVGPVELEWATWGDRVLWQANVSAHDGTFLPWVSTLAAATAATALCDLAANGERSSAVVSDVSVREDRWVVGGDDDFEESTQIHGRAVT